MKKGKGKLDNLVKYVLEEIALCGKQGASLSEVLKFLEEYVEQSSRNTTQDVANIGDTSQNGKATRSVDRPYQNYVWTWLVRHPDVRVGKEGQGNSMSLSQLEAYNNSLNASKQVITNSAESVVQSASFDDAGKQDGRIEGALPVESTKDSGTMPISKKLENTAKPDEPLRVYASEKRMWLAITGHGPDSIKVPGKDWILLTVIAAHREKGILQPDLGRLSEQDKRSVPARTDRLHERGYIIKSAVQGKGLPTSLCVLKRFAPKPTQFLPMTSQLETESGNPLDNKLLSDDRAVNPYRYTQESMLLMKPLIEDMLDMLRKAKSVPLHEIKKKLGVSTMTWASRVLGITIRRLEKLGFVLRVKPGFDEETSRDSHYKRHIKLIQDPDKKGLEHAFDLTKKVNSHGDASNEGLESANGDMMDVDVISPGTTALTPQTRGSIIPVWTAQRPISSILFDLVKSSGLDGISLAQIRDRSHGTFFQRPIEHHMSRLVAFWQVSQPLHLRHLAIVREPRTVNGINQYGHYTFENFKELVNKGERTWASVESLQENKKGHRPPKVSANAVAKLDDYGFPLLAASKFENHYKGTTYAGCIKAANVSSFRLTKKDPSVVKRADGSYELQWNISGAKASGKSSKAGSSQAAPSNRPRFNAKPRADNPQKKLSSNRIGRPRSFPKFGLPSDVSNLSDKQLARLRQSQHAAKRYRIKKLENEIDLRTKENGETWEEARAYAIAAFRAQEPEDTSFDIESELPKIRPTARSNRKASARKGVLTNEASAPLPKPYFPSTAAHILPGLLVLGNKQTPEIKRRGKARPNNTFKSILGYYPSIVAHRLRAWRFLSVKPSPASKKKAVPRVKSKIGYYASIVTHRISHLKPQNVRIFQGTKKVRQQRVRKPKNDVEYSAFIVSHDPTGPSDIFEVETQRGESHLPLDLSEISNDISSRNLDLGGHLNTPTPIPVKEASRPRKRSSKAANLDEYADSMAIALETRPQKRAKPTDSWAPALEKMSRDEQANNIARPTSGIYIGRQIHLKTGKRGLPPKSRLAIFKSSDLRARSWFSEGLHAPDVSNPLVDQTVKTPFPARNDNSQRLSSADLTLTELRPEHSASRAASTNILVSYQSLEASSSSSDTVMTGITHQLNNGSEESTMMDQSSLAEASEPMQTEADFAHELSYSSTVQPLSSEQSHINSTPNPLIPEAIVSPPSTAGKKRKRTVRFASELEQSGLSTSNTASNPPVAKKRRRTTLPNVDNHPTPKKRAYKRKSTNASLAATTHGQQIPNQSVANIKPSFAMNVQSLVQPAPNIQSSLHESIPPVFSTSQLLKESRSMHGTINPQSPAGEPDNANDQDIFSTNLQPDHTMDQERTVEVSGTSAIKGQIITNPAASARNDATNSSPKSYQDTTLDCQRSAVDAVLTESIVESNTVSGIESPQGCLRHGTTVKEGAINPSYLSSAVQVGDENSFDLSSSLEQPEVAHSPQPLDFGQAALHQAFSNQEPAQAGNSVTIPQSKINVQALPTFVSEEFTRKTKTLTRARQSIILDILNKCGGVFPGERELWYPLNTIWLKGSDTQKQEQQTIKKAVKTLVDTNKIRHHWFTINNRKGVPEARSILTLRTVPPTDPKIKETLNSIVACNPRLYVPKEVEVLKTLRKAGELVRHGTQDLEVDDEDGLAEVTYISVAERRKIAREFLAEKNRDPEAEKMKMEKHLEQLAAKAERAEKRKVEAEKTRKIMQEKREQRIAKRIGRQQRQATTRKIERLRASNGTVQGRNTGKGLRKTRASLPTEHLSFLREEDLLAQGVMPVDRERYRQLSRMVWNDDGQYGSQLNGSSSSFESILCKLESPSFVSTLMNPKQIFHPLTGTFSSESCGLYFENLLFSRGTRPLRRSTLMDPKHNFHPSTGTFSVEFSGIQFGDAFSSRAKRVPKSVLTHKKGGRKPKSAEGHSIVVPAKRKRAPPNSTLKKRRLMTLQEKLTVVKNKEIPKAPKGNVFKRIRARGPNISTYLDEDDERRILVAVIIVRVLIGGIEQNIDWTLLSIVLPEYSQFFIHRRWNSLRQKYKLQIDDIRTDFQEMYIRAYEKGKIPPLDYDNIGDYDWRWLIEWTLENLDDPMEDLPDLPESRTEFDETFVLREKPEGNTVDLYEINGAVPVVRRSDVAHEETCAVPYKPSQPHSTVTPSDHDILKSLVKANIINPDETYDPEAARLKFTSFDHVSTQEVVKELLSDKVIITGNKTRLAPGRTYDISDNFIKRFRRPPLLQVADYQRAITFKTSLDSAFEKQGSFDFSPLAQNGDVCVILNLLAQGRITMRPTNPPMKPFGLMDGKYETRFMPKSRLRFPVTLKPTAQYCPGNPLLPLNVPPPRHHPADKDVKIPRCPIWYDIKGDLSLLWPLTLACVLSILSRRPAVRKEELRYILKEGLEIWELECMMGWLVDVGAAEWVGDKKDMDNVMLKEWWWSVVPDFVT